VCVASSYGIVMKAKWRGTEVAVKTIAAQNITKDMERGFREEVQNRLPTVAHSAKPIMISWAALALP
jgi:hypothetical protein